uniref:LSDAT_euk domain-containing protein n=1 Tax=Heterorhabditis bacteriophora TaxID=37862 RepID=A0A1I7X7E1_HETBA
MEPLEVALRYGAEIILRKRLETYLAQKEDGKRGNGPSIPVVCVVLEGGAFTIKVVNDYVTTNPRIPVVVCDGSGRAADLLAFTHHAIGEDGKLSDSIHKQLMSLVETVFNYDEKNAKRTVRQLVECAKQRNLMTIFRLGESQRQDVDHAILSALLKGQNLTSSEQLQLALAWNRADIARTEIFTLGTEWTNQDLHNAMMEALCYNRTDFVKLLLENGVSMHRFLTYGRLEHLYNTDKGPAHTLRSKLGIASKKHRLRLTEVVGHAMEDLMGNAYKSNYTKDDFKAKYFVFTNRRQLGYRKTETERQRSENLKEDKEHEHSVRMDLLHTARNSIISIFGGKHQMDDDEDNFSNMEEESLDFTFKYPYSELLIWAVLTKRQSMAMLMWKHGEEAMAKSLVACRLYDALASDASQNYLELEICEELRNNSEVFFIHREFRALSIEVLQYCCDQDKDMTLQLLTYELTNWGSETCLSLAALNNNRQFLAHPWFFIHMLTKKTRIIVLKEFSMFGIIIQVLLALFMPIAIFLMEYKTKEEMMLQPHTAAEHHEENWETDSSISDATGYSDSSSSESEELMRDKLRFSSRHDNVINSSGNIVYSDFQMRVKRRSTQKHSGLYVSRPQSAQYNVEEKELRRRQESRSADITKVAISILGRVVCILLYYCMDAGNVQKGLFLKQLRKQLLQLYKFSCYLSKFQLVMIIMIDRKKPMWKKAKLYFWNYRNGILAMATTTYIIAFFIRLHPASSSAHTLPWHLKWSVSLRIKVHFFIPRMLPILAMLFVALLSFGLIREAITYPYEDWSWLLIRNIFYKPYYMLYGEVYAPEIDTCNDELWDKHIQEGVPINSGLLNATGATTKLPIFYARMLFLLISFLKCIQVMEYDSTPFIPPPFTIIYHVYWLIKWLRVRKRFFSRQNLLDASLSQFFLILIPFKMSFVYMKINSCFSELFLSEEQVEKIHSFEEECVEDMEREKDIRKQSSNDERIHRTAERSEQILNRLNNLSSIDIFLKKDVRELESRMKSMENRHKEELEFMKQINNKLELLLRFNYGNHPHEPNFKKEDRVSGDGHKNEDNNLESERQQNYSTAELSTTPSVLLQKQANTKHIRKSSAVPHIVFDLVDSGSPPKIQEPLSAPESSHEPGTESENELINTEIVPLPRMLGNQSRRGHNFYSSIADSILIDDDLYSDFPPLHFHYEPEPIISEESICDCFDGYSGHLCEQVVRMDRHNAMQENIFQAQMMLPKSKEYARKQWLNITEQISQEEEEEITRKLALKYKVITVVNVCYQNVLFLCHLLFQLLIIMTIIMTAFACCLIFAYYKMLKLKCDVRVRRILMEELINETERRNHLKRLYMSPPSYFECAALPVDSHKMEDLTDDRTTNEHEDEGNITRITNQNQEVTVVSTEHRLYLHV